MHTDVNACDCTRECKDIVRESALTFDSGRKIPCRTEESNLRQQRASPTLCQLCYIPILLACSHILKPMKLREKKSPLNAKGPLEDDGWRPFKCGRECSGRSSCHHLSPLTSVPDLGEQPAIMRKAESLMSLQGETTELSTGTVSTGRIYVDHSSILCFSPNR